jgi:hypothetical protein
MRWGVAPPSGVEYMRGLRFHAHGPFFSSESPFIVILRFVLSFPCEITLFISSAFLLLDLFQHNSRLLYSYITFCLCQPRFNFLDTQHKCMCHFVLRVHTQYIYNA